MIVDCQAHWAPRWFPEAMAERADPPCVRGERLWIDEVCWLRLDERFWDLRLRLQAMDEAGVDVQAVSFPPIGVDRLEPPEAEPLVRRLNDELLEACARRPDRLWPIGTLYLPDVPFSLAEMERCLQGGMRGFLLHSNVRGRPLDAPELLPLFELAHRRDTPLLLHPAHPLLLPHLGDHPAGVLLAFGLGFMVDSSLAALRLLLSGLWDRLPGLRLMVPHIGGVIPYVVQRFEVRYAAVDYAPSLRKTVGQYLREDLWFDSVSGNPAALRCALEVVGPERICFGSDWPFWDLRAARESLQGMPEEILQNGVRFFA